jgi:penicillin-binding protein 1A
VLYEWRDDGARVTVINNPPLSEMNRMMRQVIAAGTGRGAAISGYDLAGKTGTTSDFKDAWFVGYTGDFVTAVWVGRDDDTPMRRITGGSAPASIWRSFMLAALPRINAGPIPAGPGAPVQSDPIGDLLNQSEQEGADSSAPPASGQPPAAAAPTSGAAPAAAPAQAPAVPAQAPAAANKKTPNDLSS